MNYPERDDVKGAVAVYVEILRRDGAVRPEVVDVLLKLQGNPLDLLRRLAGVAPPSPPP